MALSTLVAIGKQPETHNSAGISAVLNAELSPSLTLTVIKLMQLPTAIFSQTQCLVNQIPDCQKRQSIAEYWKTQVIPPINLSLSKAGGGAIGAAAMRQGQQADNNTESGADEGSPMSGRQLNRRNSISDCQGGWY